MSSRATTIESPGLNRQSYFFMFFVKSIHTIHHSEAQYELKFKFSVFKGSQILSTTRQPITICFRNGWAKPEKAEVAFLLKDQSFKNASEFIVKMTDISTENENALGEIVLYSSKYINKLENESQSLTEEEAQFGDYQVDYCIFVDKNRHNLEKIAKSYKKSEGYMQISPNPSKQKQINKSSDPKREYHPVDLPVSDFSENNNNNHHFQTKQNMINQNNVLEGLDNRKEQKDGEFNLKHLANANAEEGQMQSKDPQAGQILEESEIQQNFKINYSDKNSPSVSSNLNQSPIKKPDEDEYISQFPSTFTKKHGNFDDLPAVEDGQGTLISSNVVNQQKNNMNEDSQKNIKKSKKHNKQSQITLTPTESIMEQIGQHEDQKQSFQKIDGTKKEHIEQAHLEQSVDWKLTLKILVILVLVGVAFISFKNTIMQRDTVQIRPTPRERSRARQRKSATQKSRVAPN